MATLNLGRLKPVFRGSWNNATAYNVDDIVVRNNQSYISIQAGTNQDPATATAYWTLMAAAGTDVGATLANKEIAFKTNAGVLDGIPIGNAGEFLKVNSGATGYEYGAAGGGKVLQVVNATYTAILNITDSGGDTNPEVPRIVPGLEVAITPSATTSKILLMSNILGNGGNNEFGTIYRHTSSQAGSSAGSQASGTDLAAAAASGGRSPTLGPDMHKRGTDAAINQANMTILDSPNTTSAVYYIPAFRVWSNTTFHLNHSVADANNAGWVGRGVSSLIAMEIGV